jgi:hypothetical protein
MRLKTCVLFLTVLGGMAMVCAPLRGSAQGTPASILPNAPDASARVIGGPSDNPPASTGTDPAGPDAADVSGTVSDVYGDVVPGATVSLEGTQASNRQSQAANDNGFFEFKNVAASDAYRVTVRAEGFEPWISGPVGVTSGQFFSVSDIKLKLKNEVASVTVVANPEQIATEQVHLEEQQRVMGFIPNFYVVYDAENAASLTTKLKFQMAYKVATDPVSIGGALLLAGMNQAGDTPNYQQGMKGYGQRFGAAYGNGVTDIMFGGAILPSIFHQDPRYFYQGTGTTKSRLMHALANPFICRGDNGRNEFNISSLGGDLISSALSNTYYPSSNRGPSLVFGGFALSTGEREVSSVIQEFVLRKLTPSAKRR